MLARERLWETRCFRIRTFVVGAETSSGHANGDGGASNGVADVVRTAFTNTLAYRGLVPTEQAKERGVKIDLAKRPHCFVGSDKVQPIFNRANDSETSNKLASILSCFRSKTVKS